ncbi:MAG: hypothetical protein RIC35_23600 [Marinoscillum sp.]
MEEIYGFSKVEYLVTFHSIIFGYIASVFLEGWGYLLRRRKLVRPDRFLIFFTLEVFTLMLIHWWNLYDRAGIIGLNLANFLAILPYSILFYFIGTISFARTESSNIQALAEVYFVHRLKLYGCLLLFIIYDFAITIHQENHVFQMLGLGLCVAGIASANRKLHISLLILGNLSLGALVLKNLMSFNHHFIGSTLNYSKVEHLTIFTSMIYGYVITVFLVGWSRMLRTSTLNFSWTQFLWSLFAFLFLIDIWWGSWFRNTHIASSLLHFLLSIATPLFTFIIGVLLFPLKEERGDYLSHFLNNKKQIFTAFALLFLTQIVLSFFFLESGQSENYLRLVGFVLSIISIRVNSLLYHRLLVSIASILLVLNLLNQFSHSI